MLADVLISALPLLYLVWPLLSLVTLFFLRQQQLPGSNKLAWVLIILLLPFLGVMAYWIVQPKA